ncbi:MAG TPA: nucleotidyltransferase family protein [Vicinamibacteria bacterium]|jgi:CTP:molybdopterin cytidylyltransferase MocA
MAVVLAAGAGTRMGGPKALLRWREQPFLRHAVAALRRPGVAEVAVVLGHDAARVRAEAAEAAPDRWLVNPRHGEGMLTSIWAGLDAAVEEGMDAVLVHPVDLPAVSAATVDRVLAALAEGAPVAVPSFRGRRGHPGGFALGAWPALRGASPAEGARVVMALHPDWVVHVEGDAGCLADVDRPEDYARLPP